MYPHLSITTKSALIKKAFDQFHEFPLKVWKPLAEHAELVDAPAETVLKKAGRIENHVNLIIEGSIGIMLWRDADLICTDILIEGEFACEYLSFITQQATPHEVIALEKIRYLRFTYKAFDIFLARNSHGDKIWRHALQALYVDKLAQQQQLLTLTATQRYRLMIEHQGFIIHRIPQKYIASYLGVTQQSLSRMRRNIR